MKKQKLLKLLLKLNEHCNSEERCDGCPLDLDGRCMFRGFKFHEIISRLSSDTCMGEVWIKLESAEQQEEYIDQFEQREIKFPYYRIYLYDSAANTCRRMDADCSLKLEEALLLRKTYGDNVIVLNKGEKRPKPSTNSE